MYTNDIQQLINLFTKKCDTAIIMESGACDIQTQLRYHERALTYSLVIEELNNVLETNKIYAHCISDVVVIPVGVLITFKDGSHARLQVHRIEELLETEYIYEELKK